MRDFLRVFRVFSFGVAVGLYRAFVIQQLWNWFVVEVLGTSPVSYWVMGGALLAVTVILGAVNPEAADKPRWDRVLMLTYASIPADRKAEVDAEIKSENDMQWFNAGWMAMTLAFELTVTLAIGWVIHTLLA